MWRTRGACGSPTEGKTAQEIATPAFARAVGLIACAVAAYAADAVERRIGSRQDAADAVERRIGSRQDAADVRRWAMRVRGYLTDHGLANGDRLDSPAPA